MDKMDKGKIMLIALSLDSWGTTGQGLFYFLYLIVQNSSPEVACGHCWNIKRCLCLIIWKHH